MNFHSAIAVIAASCLLLAGASAVAAPPAAPQVTSGSDTKLLRFDWEAVPGATRYEL